MDTIKLIKATMVREGMSNKDLAQKIGVSGAYLHRILCYNVIGNIRVLNKICAILDITYLAIKKSLVDDYAVELDSKWDEAEGMEDTK